MSTPSPAMDLESAKGAVLAILRDKGRATNSALLRALGQNQALLAEVREELILDDLARDKDGAGLIYLGEPASRVPAPDDTAHNEPSEMAPVEVDTAQVFISYGHADAFEFASRLRNDLIQRGYKAWMDNKTLRGGTNWVIEIEIGIARSFAFIAVLTPHATRPGGWCPKEVLLAHNDGKHIVPVRPFGGNIRSLLLVDLHQVDFSDSYETGLQELVATLEAYRQKGQQVPVLSAAATQSSAVPAAIIVSPDGQLAVSGSRDKTLRVWDLEPERSTVSPIVPIMPPPVKSRFADVSGIRPFNFAREISAHLDQFVGRRWLKAKVKHWLAHESHPVFVLIGAPGIGKSAIACWLSQEMEGQVISLHLCSSRTMRTLDPYEYVAALVRQLVEMLPGFEAALGDVDVARRRPTAKQAFEELVIAPLKAMTAPAAPRLLIVDSLDEALIQNGETILDVIVACAPELPVWLRLLATTRPEEPVLERIRGLNSFELQADQRENQQDVANFLADAVNQEDLRHCLGAEVAAIAQRLAGLANGNFLYARMTVNALQRGELKVADLQRLSGGLEDFFSAAFARHFTEPLDFEQRIRPLLELLSAAFGPLSLAILEVALGVDALELRRRLSPLRLYLRQIPSEDDTQIAFAHKLLRDWLTVPSLSGAFQIDPACGHRRLGTTLLDRWSADAYALHHLPSHLIAAERWDDLIGDDTSPGPLTDLRYIQAKCEAGLVYELVGDFNACFAALPDFCEENERNGRYDVATLLHNTALREYAVVRCDWWFAKKRGETLPEPSYPLLLGASRYPGIKKIPDELSPRAARLVHFSCFVFNHFVSMSSEARRAASVSSDHTIRIWDLETGECLRTLAGHVALVSSVSISPDGRRAASVSSDSTVRFWDLETGMCLHVLSGHAASVTSVSVSPDGRRAVSASWDGTLRVWELDTGLCLRSLKGHTGSVTSVHVGPDGRRMVTGSDDKTVRVWDLETGECLLKLIGHEHGVDSVSVTPDGRRAVSVSFCDNTLRVWDLESGEWLYTYKSATAT